MRVHAGRLEALLRRVERLPGESLARALERRSTSARARAPRAARDAHPSRRHARDGLPRAARGPARGSTATGAGRNATSSDERELVAAAQARLRASCSYTNLGFAARAGGVHDLGAARAVRRCARTRRVGDEPAAGPASPRRARAGRRPSRAGRTGGRPAALFRFASQRLEVTDEFAALRPPR